MRSDFAIGCIAKTCQCEPDLVFPSRRKVIFVNGCFWHGHDCERGARIPKTNRAYWVRKIDRNRARDQETLSLLEEQGWKALTLWECEMRKPNELRKRVMQFLRSRAAESKKWTIPLESQQRHSFGAVNALKATGVA